MCIIFPGKIFERVEKEKNSMEMGDRRSPNEWLFPFLCLWLGFNGNIDYRAFNVAFST
jgi:hypothetical protein